MPQPSKSRLPRLTAFAASVSFLCVGLIAFFAIHRQKVGLWSLELSALAPAAVQYAHPKSLTHEDIETLKP